MQKVAEQEMTVATPHRLFNVDDYYRMGEAGIFGEEERVELIEGQITTMAPIGIRHAGCVNYLNNFFARRLQERAIVSVQNPVRLSEHSEPQPDLCLLRPEIGLYRESHPTADDLLLLVEVAETSTRYDREVKVPLYASAGIAEVWIVNLAQNVVEVYRNPSPEGYGSVQQVAGNQQLAPQAFPELVLEAGSLFGTGANTDT
ncbi:MAG TPA: Uma2 family endonuclease [Ardenticatenaceae bacterium]